MPSWTKQPLLNILRKLNDVPLDDERENRQLSILMMGVADINREMMKRAAQATRGDIARTPMDITSIDDEPDNDIDSFDISADELSGVSEEKDLFEDFDAFDEELDMIEQTLIRSIGD